QEVQAGLLRVGLLYVAEIRRAGKEAVGGPVIDSVIFYRLAADGSFNESARLNAVAYAGDARNAAGKNLFELLPGYFEVDHRVAERVDRYQIAIGDRPLDQVGADASLVLQIELHTHLFAYGIRHEIV